VRGFERLLSGGEREREKEGREGKRKEGNGQNSRKKEKTLPKLISGSSESAMRIEQVGNHLD